eukprot:3613082-Prymnesium_polylepis.1
MEAGCTTERALGSKVDHRGRGRFWIAWAIRQIDRPKIVETGSPSWSDCWPNKRCTTKRRAGGGEC